LIRENGETVKKNSREDKVFYLSLAIKANFLVLDESLIAKGNEELYRIKDFFKNSNGNLKIKYVKFYDSIFFISRFFDKLLFSKFFGKNLLAIISIN